MRKVLNFLQRCFDGRYGARSSIFARWIFLRALALIYFSAFYSLLFQIRGLIGPAGIEPAGAYLRAASHYWHSTAWWHVPSVFWISSSSAALMTVTWIGLLAAVVAFFNFWPRVTLFVCWICFLAFVSASGDFSSYQSDGMLLEAGMIALFFAPPGIWPGFAEQHPASMASLWLLRWEWFRIYFESGLVKEISGDPQWRHFTAMDEYYQNSPLPTWIGWYVQHLPHWFHATTAVATLAMELVLAFMVFFPRRIRMICFLIVTPWEVGVILTGNYAFLNYLVLSLGFLLLDDRYLEHFFPARFRSQAEPQERWPGEQTIPGIQRAVTAGGLLVSAVFLTWIGYATTAELVGMIAPRILPRGPADALESFRIANQYGLFAVMTRGRYLIEFQGSDDGQNWKPYLFRHAPQLLNEAPGIYAPYQPRFDWNLWFASLGSWNENDIVPITETKLLSNDRDVIGLFRSDPFAGRPPRMVRAVLWQYWFTTLDEKRQTGHWWRRKLLGVYAPVVERAADGQYLIAAPADDLPPHD